MTLVIMPGALGDTVLRIQAVALLRSRGLVGDQLWLVGRAEYLEVARKFLPVIRTSSFEERLWSRLFCNSARPDAEWCRQLRGVRRVLVWMPEEPGARRKLVDCGLEVIWADPRRATKSREHQLVRLLCAAGLPRSVVSYRDAWRSDPPVRAIPERLLIHPGAGSPAKRLALSFYQRIATEAVQAGLDVTWLLGPAETESGERPLPVDDRVRVESQRSVCDLISILQDSDIVVGNDSGVLHLAAALGRQVVSIFVASDPEIWHPIGPRTAVIDLRLPSTRIHFYKGLRPVSPQAVPSQFRTWVGRVAEAAKSFAPASAPL